MARQNPMKVAAPFKARESVPASVGGAALAESRA